MGKEVFEEVVRTAQTMEVYDKRIKPVNNHTSGKCGVGLWSSITSKGQACYVFGAPKDVETLNAYSAPRVFEPTSSHFYNEESFDKDKVSTTLFTLEDAGYIAILTRIIGPMFVDSGKRHGSVHNHATILKKEELDGRFNSKPENVTKAVMGFYGKMAPNPEGNNFKSVVSVRDRFRELDIPRDFRTLFKRESVRDSALSLDLGGDLFLRYAYALLGKEGPLAEPVVRIDQADDLERWYVERAIGSVFNLGPEQNDSGARDPGKREGIKKQITELLGTL